MTESTKGISTAVRSSKKKGEAPLKKGEAPLKKEFVTYWSLESLDKMVMNGRRFSTPTTEFLGYVGYGKFDAVLPDGIKFNDLFHFVGRKTRVTIEVIP